MYQFVFSEKEREDMIAKVEEFDKPKNEETDSEKNVGVLDGQEEISLYDLKNDIEEDDK